MKKPFPIFVDLETAVPLVIGNDQILHAKIRLLLKFSPLIEVISDLGNAAFAAFGTKVRHLHGVRCADAHAHIEGRPLVILETLDADLNKYLANIARGFGVPVNVPDNLALCSFYLGSIVDRAPVTVAISTSGMAPVLGQNLRARIEDMLPTAYGELAHYLYGLRVRLRHLPGTLRRHLHHRIINGRIAGEVMAGALDKADAALVPLIREAVAASSKLPPIHVIDISGDPHSITAEVARAIRNADSIFYDHDLSADLLELARREVDLVALPQRFIGMGDDLVLSRNVIEAGENGRNVVCLTSANTKGLVAALRRAGAEIRALRATANVTHISDRPRPAVMAGHQKAMP